MKRKVLAVALTLLLLPLASVELGSIKLAFATSDETFPLLSMPVEYINYTITTIEGSSWAIVDGDYPIYVSNHSDYSFNGELPMVYPMPPNTTNIHLYLADKELSWTNYTQTYPNQLHHTAIGDWWMIHSILSNISGFFELKIHYEHPLQTFNGSPLFLYDLNISPYLSAQSNTSTAFFTIKIQTDFTNLKVYSTEMDDKWSPITFTSQKNDSEVILVEMYSEYGKPILGDLVVTFSQDSQIIEFPLWTFPLISIAILLVALFYRKKLQKTALKLH